MAEQLMSAAHVRAQLDISTRTLNRYVRDGVLAVYYLPGSTHRKFATSDVDALLERCRYGVAPTGPEDPGGHVVVIP